MPTGTLTNPALAQQLLDALDALSGLHPGFRPAHAKGLMCAGLFTPSPEAAHLTRAPHASRPSTPVTVRYSNATGLPTIPDNDPAQSGPRGIAIRFHLAEHVHTDIVAHSTNGFPVRTGGSSWRFSAPRPPSGRADLRRSARSSAPTRTRSGLSTRPSRSPRVSRGRRSSLSRRSPSPTLTVGAVTGGFASDLRPGPRTSLTKTRRRSPRTSCSTRSANDWPRNRSGSVCSCTWRSPAMTSPTPVCRGRTVARRPCSAPSP